MKYYFSIKYEVFKKYQVFSLNGDSILQLLIRGFLMQNFRHSFPFLDFTEEVWMFVSNLQMLFTRDID